MRTLTLGLLVTLMCSCRPQHQDFAQWDSPNASELRDKIAANPNDASAYYWRGYSASHIYDVKTVNESYRKAIELDPTNEWYQISYGWALFNAAAFAEARDQWLRAYDVCSGKHRHSQITVALGYYGVGDYQKAAFFYDKQVTQNPSFETFTSLQEATSHWTWREKNAVYDLYDIWRYSYGK